MVTSFACKKVLKCALLIYVIYGAHFILWCTLKTGFVYYKLKLNKKKSRHLFYSNCLNRALQHLQTAYDPAGSNGDGQVGS